MSKTYATPQPVYTLWAFGSNGSGQLGIGHTEDVSFPHACNGDSTLPTSGIRQIAAGGNHTVAIFTDGTLASTGSDIMAQDKRINTMWQHEWIPGAEKHKIALYVGATWSATIACYNEGYFDWGNDYLCSAGTGNSGELGQGPNHTLAKEGCPILQNLLFDHKNFKVAKIASCMGHVVMVRTNGEAWGWGKGRKGQLGEPAENVWKPRKIEGIPFKVVDAVCGKDFTCLFGDPSSGELLILGLAGSDRFSVKKNAPDRVPGWKQVAASWGSIYVLLVSGELLSWGRDDHGQLSPPGLPLLTAIAAGSEHCLGLTKDGKVLAWGWGEHGNCGMHIDDKGDVKGRFNTIAMSQPATAIFAGCATSFIVTSERLDPTEVPN